MIIFTTTGSLWELTEIIYSEKYILGTYYVPDTVPGMRRHK